MTSPTERDPGATPEIPVGGEVTAEFILCHANFVRALARGLLRDEAQVDDVVQETLARALEQGPKRREALAAWLRTVARNIAYKGHRTRSRRERREREAAKPEALPSVGDLFIRDVALRDLTAAVLDLPEQAREAIMLRYYEGLSAQAIAARLALPPGTVRMRLHRALVALRRRLDEQAHGDRAQWLRGLAVLAGVRVVDLAPAPATELAPSASPGPALSAALGLAAVVALVALGALALLGGGPNEAPTADLARGPEGAEGLGPWTFDGASVAPVGGAPRAADGRLAAATLEPPGSRSDAAAEPPVDAAGPTLRGRVVDDAGVGVSGAVVLGAWAGSELIPRGRSGAAGDFALALGESFARTRAGRSADAPFLLAAHAAGHAPSGVSVVEQTSGVPEAEPVLRLRGPGASLRANVVDADGAPIARASVRVGDRLRHGMGLMGPMSADEENPLAPQLAARVEFAGRSAFAGRTQLRGSLGAQLLPREGALTRGVPARAATTDEEGRVTLDGLEPTASAVYVRASGFAPLRVMVPLAPGDGDGERRLVLTRAASVAGRVARADGLPAGRVLVHAALDAPFLVRTVAVDAEGRYAFGELPAGACRIVAEELRDGRAIARAETRLELRAGVRHDASLALSAAGERPVRLTSGGAPLSGWRLEVRGRHNPLAVLERAVTDAEGWARLAAQHVVPVELSVLPPDPEWLLPVLTTDGPYRTSPERSARASSGASVDTGPYAIEVPSALFGGAVVVGHLTLSGGAPAPVGAFVLLSAPGSTLGMPGRVLDARGRFEVGPLPAGTYRLLAPEVGLGAASAALIEVGGAGRLDVGEVRLPDPAHLDLVRRAVDASGASGASERWADLTLTRVFDAPGDEHRLVLFEGRVELPGTLAVAPGVYEAEFGAREAGAPVRVVLAAGSRTRLEAP